MSMLEKTPRFINEWVCPLRLAIFVKSEEARIAALFEAAAGDPAEAEKIWAQLVCTNISFEGTKEQLKEISAVLSPRITTGSPS